MAFHSMGMAGEGRSAQNTAMRRWSAGRMIGTLAGSLLLWAVLAGGCLLVGSTGELGWPTRAQVEWRIEVVLLASLVGAALAGAGVVYQAILRNPLADPYLLGVSSGAALFAYLWRFGAMGAVVGVLGLSGQAASQQVFAFAGALLAMGVVFALASRGGRLEPITLILVGVIVNAVNGSIFLLLNALYMDMAAGAGGAFAFLVGGIQVNLTLQQQLTAAGVVLAGWVVLLSLTGQLNVAVLSEGEAQSLGVRIHSLRWVGLVVASLVTAAGVAISGPIGFVGLVAPHMGRLIVGNDQRRLLPVATALGAALLAVADAATRLLAREALAQVLLPVGVLTGLMGGPFFLYLLWRRQGVRGAGFVNKR